MQLFQEHNPGIKQHLSVFKYLPVGVIYTKVIIICYIIFGNIPLTRAGLHKM